MPRNKTLGVTNVCRLPSDVTTTTTCETVGKTTLCIGDRVERNLTKKPVMRGTVVAVGKGRDNNKRANKAAFVCWNDSDPGDLAYPYLFDELRKPKR